MKRNIILISFLATLLFFSSCGTETFFLDTCHGVLFSLTDNYVNTSGNQQLEKDWNKIKDDISPNPSYGAIVGNNIAQRKWGDAVLNTASGAAVAAGIDEKIVALGNSGITKWVNGDNNESLIDIAQIGTQIAVGSKAYKFDALFESQRIINQINQEYRKNIRNGMSESEARQIKNYKIGQEIANVINWGIERDKELKMEEKLRKKQIREGIIQRGYSESEAAYISSFIEGHGFDKNEDGSFVSIEEVLNYYHVGHKVQSNDGSFFDDDYHIQAPVVVKKVVPTVEEKPVTPKPVDPSADAKARLKEIAADRYMINHVGLNKTQRETLDEVASLMNQYPNIRICLNGNTCDLGSDYVNELIATKRANHAKDYLVKQGVDANRIETESKAASNPKVKGKTVESRLKNRRVSITVLED